MFCVIDNQHIPTCFYLTTHLLTHTLTNFEELEYNNTRVLCWLLFDVYNFKLHHTYINIIEERRVRRCSNQNILNTKVVLLCVVVHLQLIKFIYNTVYLLNTGSFYRGNKEQQHVLKT